jgi:site-specific DNA-methyltransferase (adenine-specific)
LKTNVIYNEDNMVGMEKLLKKHGTNLVDLIITSPPYNLGGRFHTGNNRMKSYDKYSDDLPEEEYQEKQINFLNKCYKLLDENGSMFYNHKPRIIDGKTIHPLEWILKSDFTLKQEIVWRNGSQNFDKIRFYPMTERVYWLTKKPETTLNNSIGLSDVWTFKNATRDPEHNATFPLDLPEVIMSCFPNAKIVLDPYMGVGTTAIAAVRMKKDFVGFELSEKYYEISLNRIEREMAQLTLF